MGVEWGVGLEGGVEVYPTQVGGVGYRGRVESGLRWRGKAEP